MFVVYHNNYMTFITTEKLEEAFLASVGPYHMDMVEYTRKVVNDTCVPITSQVVLED